MRCSPGVIFNVTGEMSEALKWRIQELSFGELLKLKIDKPDDRALGFFLLSCVEENPLRIQIGNRALLIIAEVVHQVFGLPVSGKSFLIIMLLIGGMVELLWGSCVTRKVCKPCSLGVEATMLD
jgi:hypothetical protein